jgi:hypothetical protein
MSFMACSSQVVPCMLLLGIREIFYIDGALFDKTGTLAEFSQLYNYERFDV